MGWGFLAWDTIQKGSPTLKILETLDLRESCWDGIIFFIQLKKLWQFPLPSRHKQSDNSEHHLYWEHFNQPEWV